MGIHAILDLAVNDERIHISPVKAPSIMEALTLPEPAPLNSSVCWVVLRNSTEQSPRGTQCRQRIRRILDVITTAADLGEIAVL